jgi:hypothetical protein
MLVALPDDTFTFVASAFELPPYQTIEGGFGGSGSPINLILYSPGSSFSSV